MKLLMLACMLFSTLSPTWTIFPKAIRYNTKDQNGAPYHYYVATIVVDLPDSVVIPANNYLDPSATSPIFISVKDSSTEITGVSEIPLSRMSVTLDNRVTTFYGSKVVYKVYFTTTVKEIPIFVSYETYDLRQHSFCNPTIVVLTTSI